MLLDTVSIMPFSRHQYIFHFPFAERKMRPKTERSGHSGRQPSEMLLVMRNREIVREKERDGGCGRRSDIYMFY